MYWGKVLGVFFGYLVGGIVGAILGGIIGHFFDQGLNRIGTHGFLNPSGVLLTREVFFKATFQIMGCLAKADGRISREEIKVAEIAMQRMQLTPERRQQAMEHFLIGKQDGYAYIEMLRELNQECGRHHDLIQFFFEFQVAVATADGQIDPMERKILDDIAQYLNFSTAQLTRVIQMMLAGINQRKHRQNNTALSSHDLKDEYMLLGVTEKNTDDEIKKAYRKLMNQHHPDKLVSKGLPKEMIQLATEKTQDIKLAYEKIKEFRNRKSV